VAVWLDGTLPSAVAAGWVARQHRHWVGLAARVLGRPERGFLAAQALAGELGAETIALDSPAGVSTPVGWALAHQAAVTAGASWLVAGFQDEGGVPVALRLHAADEALRLTGFGGIWAPVLNEDAIALARLAQALDLPLQWTWDCAFEIACGTCGACEDRKRAFKQLGTEDPAMAAVDAGVQARDATIT
jgi:hypothetical protein